MKSARLHKRLLAAAASVALGLFAAARTSQAVPINGDYHEDPRCDVIPNQLLSHELGRLGFFPANESFEVNFQPSTFTVCVPDDGVANDWNVQIRNLSGIPWMNLFFVVDLGATLGNADGTVQDVAGAPGVFTDSMKIDGTVTAGINNNLFFENMTVNEIFEPGEIWRFNVSNFINYPPGGAPQPPIFVTPGRFAGSMPLGASQGNASILAVPVPEPTVAAAIVLGGVALMLKRPSRRS
jgi:hypothetical protein